MEYLQARLESFSKSKRAKNSSARHASSSSKWPHPSSFKATPDSLAEAGFYFDPDPDNPDNVTCFMCKKGVADWAPEDDPFSIHYDKCAKSCAWAMVRCQRGVGGESFDSSDSTRHPTSKAIEKARLETFSKVAWPHDGVKGHGANSKALAKAGFICNSTEPGDDTALCLYCNLSLSGWDEDDDPYDEHLKRDKKKGTSCAFLQAYAGNSLGKSTAKRPKAAPKPPSRSASQTLRGAPASEAVEFPVDSDDELAAVPSDSSAPARTSSGRTRKTSSTRASSVTTKTPGSRRSTRGTSTAGKTPGSRTVSSDLEETEGGSESDAGRRAGKSKRKAGGKAKARVSAIAEEEDEAGAAAETVDDDVVMQEPEPEPEPEQEQEQDPPKKKRGRPPKSAAAKPASQAKGKKATAVEDEAEDFVAETDMEETRPPPAKKAHTRTRSKANVDSEAEAAPSSSKRTHTRTKSGSKAKAKQEETEEEPEVPAPAPKKGKQAAAKVEEEAEEPASAPPQKPKGRTVSRSKVKPDPRASDMDDVEPEQEEGGKSHTRTDSGRSAASRGAKPSHGSKSSLSEDAGYATAEPPPDADQMDIDEPSPPPPPPPKSVEAPAPPKAQPRARTVSRSTTANDNSGKRPSPAPNGVRSSSVASSSRPSVARPPSKLNKDSLQVIEIDSDGEETGAHGPPAKATAKGKAPMSRAESMTLVNNVKKPTSQASRKKLQVEVVVPSQPARPKAMEVEAVDVQMQEESPTSPVHTQPTGGASSSAITEPQLPESGTPVSAVHRSAHPSPVREADARIPSPEAEVIETVSQSPRTYHPFLAQLPIEKLDSLTEEETEMTLEQYIRREMEIQYAQLKADGERRIDEFKQKAAETKRLIESS